MPECSFQQEWICQYVEGSLPGPRRLAVETHLASCGECRAVVLRLQELADLERAFPEARLAPDQAARMRSRLERLEAPGPSAPPPPTPRQGWGFLAAAAGIGGGLMGLGGAHALPGLAHGKDLSDSPERFPWIHPSMEGKTDAHPFPPHLPEHAPMSQTFHPADTVFGTPGDPGHSETVQQHHPDTCAVQCQKLILNDYGLPISEEQAVREAQSAGIYHKGEGTSPEDVGKLLELHGMEVHRQANANVFNLANELAQGHKVIVGVDSSELWQEHPILSRISDFLGLGAADHAVIVSGIDTSDPAHVKVIVTDPGNGDRAHAYPMEDFLDAWKDSHFTMVSTTEPVPASLHHPEMAHFDYAQGHIPMVGQVPFSFVHEASLASAGVFDEGEMNRMEGMFLELVHGQAPFAPNLALAHEHAGATGLQDDAQALFHQMHDFAGQGGVSLEHLWTPVDPALLHDPLLDLGWTASGADPLHLPHPALDLDPHPEAAPLDPDLHALHDPGMDPLHPEAWTDPCLHHGEHPELDPLTDASHDGEIHPPPFDPHHGFDPF